MFSINCQQGHLNTLFPINTLQVNLANLCINGSELTIHTYLSYFSHSYTVFHLAFPNSSAYVSSWPTVFSVSFAPAKAVIDL